MCVVPDRDVSKNQLEVAAFRSFLVRSDQTRTSSGNPGQFAGGLKRLNLFGNRVGDAANLPGMLEDGGQLQRTHSIHMQTLVSPPRMCLD
jgi:hypothetical protein